MDEQVKLDESVTTQDVVDTKKQEMVGQVFDKKIVQVAEGEYKTVNRLRD